MNLFSIIVGAMLLAVVVGTLVDVFRQDHSTGARVAWVVVVLVLPFVGSLIYWIARKPEPPDAEQLYRLEAEQRRAAAHRPFDSTGMGGPS